LLSRYAAIAKNASALSVANHRVVVRFEDGFKEAHGHGRFQNQLFALRAVLTETLKLA
jgi:hypothetical protein